ncbi:Putative GYF domain-containing protein [Septoria linicola]|uniref:GYF domain-containing protein n=1 Tax=Septoria linicola TaxID=215465 RepID=A0A9Q9AVQ3_9PEZI|nr:Putative GYF domain-containing protein [Septoria linicola]
MAPPSSFASAAAGNNASNNLSRDSAGDRLPRTNGATQTFRRASGATNGASSAQHAGTVPPPQRYIPPSLRANGTSSGNTKYTKDQMFDIYESLQSQSSGLSDGLSAHAVGGWQPDISNGSSAGWGRTDNNRDSHSGPELVWNKDSVSDPLGLVDMDEEERELFSTSVNTPIKPSNKDGQQANGVTGRKISISTSATTPGAFGLPSPSVARGGGRRRETSESYPFPQNVSSPGGFNEQRAPSPPASLLRRRTDQNLNKPEDKDADEKPVSSPFGTVRRNPAAGPLSAGFAAPSSPWSNGPGPQSAGLAPMGSFGSFGMSGNPSQQPAPGAKGAVGLGGGRSESRFKNVLGKEGGDDGRTIEAKPSLSGLGRVNEHESWRAGEQANESLDEAEEVLPTGSAALAADEDTSPPHPRQGYQGFGTPSRQGTQGDFGFGAFGMTTDNTHGFGQGYPGAREGFQQTPAHQRLGLQHAGGHEPMSPTDTNPYKSPEQHGADRTGEQNEADSSDAPNSHLPGLGQFGVDQAQHQQPQQQLSGLGGLGALPNLGRVHGQGPASDRSQTSSVGPQRGFSGGFSGLGQLGALPGASAWPASQGGLGTPGRQTAGLSNAFGSGIFSNPMSDMQSPGLAGLGGFGSQGGAYGGSRMASMFPPQMQDQMRHNDSQHDRESGHERPAQPFGGLGDFGRSAESPFANQGFNDNQPGKLQHESSDLHHQQSQQQLHEQSQQQGQNQPPGSSASNQPPAPQQRTMVMPDRMRWIYRDPQGQTQGPWSGLEMHDWYKAGFFSPELLVKKYEDQDYEPLAQLIRRIGNSREPFLVPQIGIPHGSVAQTGPNAWAGAIGAGAGQGGSNTAAGNPQPPFASSFPSFGTTLTAEQQNALERRKQEEQYLMARQKEHLAQAQIQQRMQLGGAHGGMGLPNQLHHHSSAHSLQSQPSFGSIQSPANYQPSPSQGPTAGSAGGQGFFDNTFNRPQGSNLGAVGAPSLGHIREEEIPGIMDRLSMNDNRQQAGQFGAPGQPFASQQQQQQQQQQPDQHEGKVQQMYEDRARLQQEQAEHDAQDEEEEAEQAHATQERLEHFQQLQGQALQQSAKQARAQASQAKSSAPATQPANESAAENGVASQQGPEPLSLTEQVQKAASAKHSPAPQQPGLPQPFPPAPSQSPLPAPAAQRAGRQSVADQLQTDSRGLSQSPSVDTPSATVAPWAKEPAEAPKGPSLREIQEAEARQAEQAEALAIAARRAAFQKEMEAQAQVIAPAPGIPTSATWGAPSPATPTGGAAAAWAKTAQKPSGVPASKTLAQIQKEEESRKRRNAAQAQQQQALANAMSGVTAPAGSKSYANLAGKVNAQPPQINTGNSAWTTVGASGKVKTPAPATPSTRTAHASIVPTVQPPVASRRQPARTTTSGAAAVNAQDEFKKWATNELRPDLAKGISVEDFVSGLFNLPPDNEIITEAVHAVSSTIDSRHFAEEFIRRKRLADKGLIDTAVPKSASPANGASGAGGWSEVAKKSGKEPPKDDLSGFAMKQTKKRGGRK